MVWKISIWSVIVFVIIFVIVFVIVFVFVCVFVCAFVCAFVKCNAISSFVYMNVSQQRTTKLLYTKRLSYWKIFVFVFVFVFVITVWIKLSQDK